MKGFYFYFKGVKVFFFFLKWTKKKRKSNRGMNIVFFKF